MDESWHDLTVAQCWERLRSTSVVRVAAVLDDRLSVRPVNAAVDGGTLLLRTAADSWLASLGGRHVVAEADGLDEPTGSDTRGQAWSVLVEGTARVITDPDELLATYAVPVRPWQGSAKPTFLRIEPTGLTGRRFAVADPEIWASPFDEVRPSPPG